MSNIENFKQYFSDVILKNRESTPSAEVTYIDEVKAGYEIITGKKINEYDAVTEIRNLQNLDNYSVDYVEELFVKSSGCHTADWILEGRVPVQKIYFDPEDPRSNQTLNCDFQLQNFKDDDPEHYKFSNGVQVYHLTDDLNFNVGNAVKYLCRAGRKGSGKILDLKKAVAYIKRVSIEDTYDGFERPSVIRDKKKREVLKNILPHLSSAERRLAVYFCVTGDYKKAEYYAKEALIKEI